MLPEVHYMQTNENAKETRREIGRVGIKEECKRNKEKEIGRVGIKEDLLLTCCLSRGHLPPGLGNQQ